MLILSIFLKSKIVQVLSEKNLLKLAEVFAIFFNPRPIFPSILTLSDIYNLKTEI
jgi:hypothetical protein